MIDNYFLRLLPIPLFFLLSISQVLSQTVSLNEIMSSNFATIPDEDGDYEDWIELYNYGNEPVNLSGFYLSDDYGDPKKWIFPEIEINPGEHLLVWASGKDISYSTLPLHTNFKISMSGEEIILANSDGKRIDELAPTSIPIDVSYGRNPDGTGTWHYLTYPTPENKNAKHIFDSPFLIHFWLFDSDIPNNTPLETVDAFYSLISWAKIDFYSCLTGYPFDENHPDWRKASMERRNTPTILNYRLVANRNTHYDDSEMRGLQIRQPFENNEKENKVVFNMPTNGFEDIIFRFAAKDEGTGNSIIIEYSVDSDATKWIQSGIENPVLNLNDDYNIYEINFASIEEVKNNPFFKIRFRFGGNNLEDDFGQRITFNNVSLDGKPIKAYYIHSTAGNFGMINPSGFNRKFKGDSVTYKIFPTINYLIDNIFVNGKNKTPVLHYEEYIGIYKFTNIYKDQDIFASFKINSEYIRDQKGQILVYSNPASHNINIKSINAFNRIDIVNLEGQIIDSRKAFSKELSLDISDLKDGFYILLIHTNKAVITKKIQVINNIF